MYYEKVSNFKKNLKIQYSFGCSIRNNVSFSPHLVKIHSENLEICLIYDKVWLLCFSWSYFSALVRNPICFDSSLKSIIKVIDAASISVLKSSKIYFKRNFVTSTLNSSAYRRWILCFPSGNVYNLQQMFVHFNTYTFFTIAF